MSFDKREELRTFGRFCLIGLAVSAAAASVFYLLRYRNVGMLPAQVLSYTVATFVSYSFNRRFTFHTGGRYLGGEIGKFFAVAAAALGLGSALVWLLSDGLGLHGTPVKDWGVKLLAMAFSALVNYVGARLWAFKPEARNKEQEARGANAKRIHN